MKFIHMADMHFDAPFAALSAREELGDIRRLEQRKAFKKIIDKIKNENIPYLFIAGDLYEHQYIRKTTIEYINNLFAEIKETQVFIAPGNHDPFLKNSYYSNYKWSNNVHIFDEEIKKYEFKEVDIYGFGFDNFYCSNSKIENIKIENKEKINILLVHGDLNASQTGELPYNPINENMVKKIGFDYIALGHIHKRYINDNIVYTGSTISLGFDELGEHGVIVGNLEKNKLELTFEKIDETEFVEMNVDISNIFSEEEIIEKIKDIKTEEKNFYKIILTGRKNIEINNKKILKIINNKKILKIKDVSKVNFDIEKIKEENNLKSYFINEIIKLKEEKKYSLDEINAAIEIGLRALQG